MTEQRTDTFPKVTRSSIWTIALGSGDGCTGICHVAVTIAEGKKSVVGIIVFDSVHQTSPIDATAGAKKNSQDPSVSITTNFDNSLIVDVLSMEPTTITATDTQNWNIDNGILGASQSQPTTTAGSYTSDWIGDESKKWAFSVIALRQTLEESDESTDEMYRIPLRT